MPFGWVGFDANNHTRQGRFVGVLSPMPFGWVGFDAFMRVASLECMDLRSPMPFGWVGFDAQKIFLLAMLCVFGLQCLSAGWALMPVHRHDKALNDALCLQCLSAGWALMPPSTL